MKTSQIIEIFNYLKDFKNNGLKDISNHFKISQRNIRYEIEKLNVILNSKIVIKKGEIKADNWDKIIDILSENSYLSYDERELYIVLILLSQRVSNQKKLASQLDISITTIKLHFRDLKKKINDYNLKLKLKPKIGLELTGEEENIRIYYLEIYNRIKKSGCKFLQNQLNIECELYENEMGIKRFINYCQKLIGIIVSDEAFIIILNYIKIAISSNRKGFKLKKIKNESFLLETKEYRCIKKASSILEEWYDIELNTEEYIKIVDYFLGSSIYNINYSYYDNWVKIEILLKEIIKDFNSYIKENILDDRILLEGLLNHIKPTIYRIKNNIKLENSIYTEIIETYPVCFDITKNVVKKLEEKINIKLTNDEISYLVIYFKAAIDRNRSKNKKFNVILVCNAGYGTSKLLSQQLTQNYNIKVVEIIPKYLVEKINIERIDFIISTVKIKSDIIDIPVIVVNSILSDNDSKILEKYGIVRSIKKISITKLLKVIKESSIQFDEKLLKDNLKQNFSEFLIDDFIHQKTTIFDYIKKNQILVNIKIADWKEGVKLTGKLLLKNNIIDEEYIKSSIDVINEFGSYMILAPEVIFPHTRTIENKVKTGFSIVILNKAIKLPTGEPVSVFIMFSSKNNSEHLDTFIKLVELANNR